MLTKIEYNNYHEINVANDASVALLIFESYKEKLDTTTVKEILKGKWEYENNYPYHLKITRVQYYY